MINEQEAELFVTLNPQLVMQSSSRPLLSFKLEQSMMVTTSVQTVSYLYLWLNPTALCLFLVSWFLRTSLSRPDLTPPTARVPAALLFPRRLSALIRSCVGQKRLPNE